MLLNLYLAFFVSRRAQFKPKRERAETERRGSGLRRESALFFRSWCRFNAAILYFIFKKKKTELFSSFFLFFISASSPILARCGPLRCDRSPPSSGYRLRCCCGRGLKVRDSDYVTAASLPDASASASLAPEPKRGTALFTSFFFSLFIKCSWPTPSLSAGGMIYREKRHN